MASTISGPSDNDALLAQILSLTGPAQDVLIANVAAGRAGQRGLETAAAKLRGREVKLLNMTGYSKPSADYDFNSLVIYDSDFDVLKKYKCPAAACGKRFFDPQSLRTHGLASGGTHRQVDYLTQLGAALVTKDTGRADGRRACPVGGCELSSSGDFAGFLEDTGAAAKHHESQHMSTHFKCRNMGDGCTLGFKTQRKLDVHHTHCGGQNSTCKTCADGDGPDANTPEYKELDCVPRGNYREAVANDRRSAGSLFKRSKACSGRTRHCGHTKMTIKKEKAGRTEWARGGAAAGAYAGFLAHEPWHL